MTVITIGASIAGLIITVGLLAVIIIKKRNQSERYILDMNSKPTNDVTMVNPVYSHDEGPDECIDG